MNIEKMSVVFFRTNEKKQKPGKEPAATADKTPAVDVKANSAVVNEVLLGTELSSIFTPSERAIYLSLVKRSHGTGHKITNWVGYRGLAAESKVCLKTVQRAIEVIAKMGLIKRVDSVNTAKKRGSKYEVFLPPKADAYTMAEKAGGHCTTYGT